MRIRKIHHIMMLGVSLFLLQSCTGLYHGGNNQHGFWFNDSDGNGYYGHRRGRPVHRPVVVTPGYHFSDRKTPRSHKERDLNWIHHQAPGDYTIEVARDTKASGVARALHDSPKRTRKAQYKYKQSDKTIYTGIYGSYKTKEEAKKALSQLPDSVKHSAKIKPWHDIQSTAQRPVPAEPQEKMQPE